MNEINVNIFPSKIGVDTVEFNGYLLHSKYDPIKEAKVIIEREYKENFLHILFGYGLGYVAEELKSKVSNDSDIIIIDPYKEIFCKDNEEVLDLENKDELKKIITNKLQYKKSEIKIICSPNYDKIASEFYLKLLKIVKKTQIFDRLNSNTIEYFAESWQENYIKNMVLASSDAQFGQLVKKFDLPVVVASGGPSLTKQLNNLKKFKDKVIIIAAGSTINSLLNAGIDPDFVVTVDGAELNYTHFKDIKDINAILLYGLSSHFKIQYNYPGEKIPFLLKRDDYINNILECCEITLPIIHGGTSVANFAFEIAQIISNGPVALIGQDLAYTNNMTHAPTNKLAKEIDEDFTKKRNVFKTEGYNGESVLTDYVFEAMKFDFEQLLKISNNPSLIYNCTEGGAKIHGFKQIPFDHFLKKFTLKQKGPVVIQRSGNLNKTKKLIEKFRNQVNALNNLEKELKKAILLIKKEKNRVGFSNALLQNLNKVDREVKKTFDDMMFSHILQPIINRVMSDYKPKNQETTVEKFNRTYRQTVDLYTSIMESVIKIKQYLNESILLKKEV